MSPFHSAGRWRGPRGRGGTRELLVVHLQAAHWPRPGHDLHRADVPHVGGGQPKLGVAHGRLPGHLLRRPHRTRDAALQGGHTFWFVMVWTRLPRGSGRAVRNIAGQAAAPLCAVQASRRRRSHCGMHHSMARVLPIPRLRFKVGIQLECAAEGAAVCACSGVAMAMWHGSGSLPTPPMQI